MSSSRSTTRPVNGVWHYMMQDHYPCECLSDFSDIAKSHNATTAPERKAMRSWTHARWTERGVLIRTATDRFVKWYVVYYREYSKPYQRKCGKRFKAKLHLVHTERYKSDAWPTDGSLIVRRRQGVLRDSSGCPMFSGRTF